jgi:enoyl-CoA hydratase/carnithine racemase
MSAVVYEVRDRIGILTLNRPSALNAIDEEVLGALGELVKDAAADEDVKAFSEPAYFRDVLERFKTLLLGIESLPLPVVAAVNGTTRAGGFEIMLACDLVLVADEARIGDTHLAYGIVPGGGATQRLPRRIGHQRARELIFSGRWLDGPEAVALGLALRSVPRSDLPKAVEDLVATFRDRSRPALAATKAAMVAGASLPLAEALDVEIEHFMRYLEDEPTSGEGFRAFGERREPRWP